MSLYKETMMSIDIKELKKKVKKQQKRIAELEKQVSDGLEYARQTYTRARLMDQKTPMMLKLLSRIERLLETLESEGDTDA